MTLEFPDHINFTDEIYKVVTRCPKLADCYGDACQENCPLWRICMDYWNGNTIE